MTRAPWFRGTLLLTVTFAAGIAVGVVFARLHLSPHGSAMHAPPGMPMNHFVDRMTRELSLDSAQRRHVASVLARRQGLIDSAWRAVHPQVRGALDSAYLEMVQVLTPDQVAAFRRMIDAMHPGMLR